MKYSSWFLLPLGLLFLCGACRQEEEVSYESEGTIPEDVPHFIVDSIPLVTLGLAPPDDRYVFSGIIQGGIIGDSLIVVVDDILKRVSIFGIDGGFRRRVITAGEGPTEVQSIHEAGILPNGWIWIYDFAAQRLLSVDQYGELVSEMQLPLRDPMEVFRLQVIGLAENGDWWLRREEAGQDREPGHFFRLSTSILRLTTEGTIREVWEGQGDLVVSGGNLVRSRRGVVETGRMRSNDLPRLLLTPYRSGVLFAWSDSSWVDWLHPDGSSTRLGRLPARRIQMPEERVPRGAPKALQALYERTRYYPEIHALRVGPQGEVWAVRPSVEEDRPAVLYRIGGGIPTAVLSSPGLRRLAVPTPDGWILAKRRSLETDEDYVSLHRVRLAHE